MSTLIKKYFPARCCNQTAHGKFRTLKSSSLLFLFNLFIVSSGLFAQLAPVNPPTGGFRIDGGLKANTPTVGQGDWVPGPAGAGGYVLTNAGVPLDATTTGLKKDVFNTTQDFIFTQGSKFNDYIQNLAWTQSTAPDKNDINNAMYHVSRDPSNNDQWIMIGGDRLSTNGTSYIDFEFLQNTVTRNAGGTFTGGGPAGGRTVNDLLISMEYTNGGVAANVYFYQWKPVAGGYAFQQFTPPAGTAFALTNGTNEDVPFGAFGSNVYQPFAFVEAAINITRLLAATGEACAQLSVKTLWIKTKASASPTAALKDFVEPIPVSFTFGTASISYGGPYCATGTATVTQTGITGGTYSASPAGLSINSTTGTIDLGASTPGTYTVTYTFNSGNNCIKKATATVVINPFPSCSISGPGGPLCPNLAGNVYSAAAGLTYNWSIHGNGSIAGSNTAQTVNVTAGSLCDSTFTLTLTVTNSNGCSSTCTKTVNVKDVTPPVITCPADKQLQCSAPTDTAHTGKATATDNCSGTITITYSDAATAAGCTGKAGIDRTWTATDGCGNKSTCVQHITFVDNTPPVITCPADKQLQCGNASDTAHTGKATATDNCSGNVVITYSDAATAASCTGKPGIDRTWTATDGCGNKSTCVQHITFVDNTPPVITCPAPVTVQCMGDVPAPDPSSVTATDNCGGTVTVTFVKDESSGSCPITILRTYKATDGCGNSSTCVQTITVDDKTPPVINCVGDVKLNCGDNTLPANTGTPTATDNCGTATLTYKDVNTSQNCFTSITRTWTATDACGNTSTCVQHIVVVDRTAPVITCPGDQALQCGESTDPTHTGSATATDNCTASANIMIYYTDAFVSGSACSGNSNIDRTWTAIDASGNMSTCVQHITFSGNQSLSKLTQKVADTTIAPKNSTKPTQADKITTTAAASQKVAATGQSAALQVKAYPNPFSNRVNFRILSPVSGKARLEIYTLSGQRLAVVFEEKVDAGIARDIQYTAPFSASTMLIYKISIGNNTASGKIQLLNK